MNRLNSLRCKTLTFLIAILFLKDGALAEEPAAGFTVRVLNERGLPVRNSRAAMFVYRNLKSGEWQHRWSGESNAEGLVQIADGMAMVDHRPVYIYDKSTETAAVARLNPEGPWEPPPAVTLSPACVIRGELTCQDLESRERPLDWYGADVYYDGLRFLQQSIPRGSAFEFHLPSGTYQLRVDSYPYTHAIVKTFTIAPDQRKLEMGSIDLPATRLSLLQGETAPELADIAAWKNSEPVSLKALRGRPVVIEFWGQWCGPCLHHMPKLMKLDDDYRAKGVMVIGVHVDVDKSGGQQLIDSVEKLDEELKSIRAELWAGRKIPFPIAISRPRQVAYGSRVADSAPSQVTADYGVVGFPTTFLIGTDGRIASSYTGTEDDFAKLVEHLDSLLVP